MSGFVKTLESWKGGTQNVLDANVNHKAYFPGAIALIVLSVALLVLLAYGMYRFYDFAGPEVFVLVPILIGVAILTSIPGGMGAYMVRQTILNRNPEAPANDVHGDL